jgi:hypothetical protein
MDNSRRTATTVVHEKIVAYATRHPELTYKQISKKLNLRLTTLAWILQKYDFKRQDSVLSVVNHQELDGGK